MNGFGTFPRLHQLFPADWLPRGIFSMHPNHQSSLTHISQRGVCHCCQGLPLTPYRQHSHTTSLDIVCQSPTLHSALHGLTRGQNRVVTESVRIPLIQFISVYNHNVIWVAAACVAVHVIRFTLFLCNSLHLILESIDFRQCGNPRSCHKRMGINTPILFIILTVFTTLASTVAELTRWSTIYLQC